MNYQQALRLYNQGDYEGAYDLLAKIDSREGKLLAAECKKLITEQYIYLLRDFTTILHPSVIRSAIV